MMLEWELKCVLNLKNLTNKTECPIRCNHELIYRKEMRHKEEAIQNFNSKQFAH